MAPGGYLWWYVDAISDDGRYGLTLIAFVGSVFSPYYRYARRGGHADPENHCAVNVALYGRDRRRWTMTERGRSHLSRSADALSIGPSALRWTGERLDIEIEEWAVPLPRRVRGRIRVYPGWLSAFTTALDDDGRHRWGPIAPRARIEVALDAPDLRWQGDAYLDANDGSEPIDRPFVEWDWSRAPMRDGSAGLLYDVRQKQGADRVMALRFAPDGSIEPFAAPPRKPLPRTAWRIGRSIRSETGPAPQVTDTLEDTPFYVRSTVSSTLLGAEVVSMHETLYVPRLVSPVVQAMLPWRMPRIR